MAIVRYLVENVDRATQFYAAVLGFQLKTRMGSAFAIVVHEDLELWLSGPGSSAARPMPDGAKPAPGGWNRIVVRVDDIADTTVRLSEANVRFRGEVVTGPGGKQVLIEDADGNPIELFESR